MNLSHLKAGLVDVFDCVREAKLIIYSKEIQYFLVNTIAY